DLRHLLVIKICARHVNESSGLLLNRTHNVRVTMPCRANRNACAKVEKTVSIDIFHDRSSCTLCNQGIGACVGRRYITMVSLHDGASLFPGERSNELRKLVDCGGHFLRHFVPSRVSSMIMPRSSSCWRI